MANDELGWWCQGCPSEGHHDECPQACFSWSIVELKRHAQPLQLIETIRCPGGALSSLIKTELFELSGKCLNLCVVEGSWHVLHSGNPLISTLPRPILGD